MFMSSSMVCSSRRTGVLKRVMQGLTLTLLGIAGTAGTAHAQNHPFGSHHQAYHTSALRVSAGEAAADKATSDFYWQWKSRYVEPGCQPDEYRIRASTGEAHVVSEGQGYGMLISVMIAGQDPQARAIFDGLHRYSRRHPSQNNPDLMAWAQDDSCRDVLDHDSATDGDLDIAYALLLAHEQWGSGGAIDYASEATRVLDAIAESNINPTTRLVNLGDWAPLTDDPTYSYATRSSDWMLGHFRSFIGHPSADWSRILTAHQTLIETMQSRYASSTGLLPDFIINTNTTPRPAFAEFLEAPHDGSYSWNASRVPWRLGIDAAISGDTRSRSAVSRISSWIRGKTGGNPSNIRAGYTLDGRAIEPYNDMVFMAPFAVAATADSGGQAWLDSLWSQIVSTAPTEDYYGDTLKLLSMLCVSRNWMTP
ncbi:beta-glucanase [Sorangium cellulosum]|uniref:Glucanase n=1 Tax=Sorangium cellulosum TaxID=56 RepID=A0A2L0EYK5_SORCE|nr:glycosyl hydrolase family 8 [Sorangium cellulosum]AUX44387.1 beta-glucanase [Sorangium cellulosum]